MCVLVSVWGTLLEIESRRMTVESRCFCSQLLRIVPIVDFGFLVADAFLVDY